MFHSISKLFTHPKRYHLIYTQVALFFCLVYTPLWSIKQDYSTESMILEDAKIYENFEVRQLLQEVIFSKDFSRITTPQQFYPQRSSGMSVGFSLKKIDPFYYLIFANNTSYQHPGENIISYHTRGSYILKKSFQTDELTQIQILIQNDSNCHIRIVSNGHQQSYLNVSIFGDSFYKNIPVPMSIERIAVAPLAKLMMITRYQIDWRTIFQPNAYEKWQKIKTVVDTIRPRLRYINEITDGAQDKLGNPVFIKTLKPQDLNNWGFNCSGFVKWIVDGFFQHLSPQKQLISLNLLTKKGILRQVQNSWNEQFEESRDPNFGIDWIRNLAYIMKTITRPLLSINLTDHDVQSVSFTSFYPDRGYPIQHLKSILYQLSIKYPDEFFFGSVSTDFGETPRLFQHRHVTAFFPYFTNKGTFLISVLDAGQEKTVENLITKFPNSFVYFVRISASTPFSLPPIPTIPRYQ